MSILDRCEICDYNEREGSGFAGLNPGDNGRVTFRFTEKRMTCDYCFGKAKENFIDLLTEEEKEGLDVTEVLVDKPK